MPKPRQPSARVDDVGSVPAAVRGTPSTTLPFWVTPALIAATQRVWQPYYNTMLTEEDAVAILLAVGRLFGALAPRPS